MNLQDDQLQLSDVIEQLLAALERQDFIEISSTLAELNPAEIAHILEATPSRSRYTFLQRAPKDTWGEILLNIGDVAGAELAEHLDKATLKNLANALDTSDVAELIDVIPDESVDDLLSGMSAQRRERVQATLSYEEETAGRLMQSDAVNVRPDVEVDTVLRYLKKLDDVPSDTVVLMVVGRNGSFVGSVTILDLIRSDDNVLVKDIMNPNVKTIHPDDGENEVAVLFETHDLIAAAVVDDDGQFLGRIVIDDVVDVIREQGEHAFLGHVGLDDEEDLFAPMIPSAKRRAVWLALNLLTAFMAAWVIGLFEHALDKVVALAILMPVVASMGGIVGTQTLTLTIRGLALGQIGPGNARRLLNKELGISILNGCVWAVVVGVVAWLWFKDPVVGYVISAALFINMVVAALAGILVPLFLERIDIDPALSGVVVVTTITDIVGFMSFLGLATLFLL
ncbi:MAG: magnesium transporter [Arenicellales bacterium]